MKRCTVIAVCCAAIGVGCSGGSEPETQDVQPAAKSEGTKAPSAGKEAKFAEVTQILSESCVSCHKGSNGQAGLDLASFDGVMKGGSKGAIVIPGDVGKSKLAMSLRGKGAKQMPMTGPLPEEKIAVVEAWIESGATKD